MVKHFQKWGFATLLLGLMVVGSCKKDECPVVEDEKTDTIPILPTAVDSTDFLKINQLQAIGSHNSYRIKTDQAIYDFVQGISGLLPAQYNPDGWDYTHLPFVMQFDDYKVRNIEIDIFNDPQGGQFYNRRGLTLIGQPAASGISDMNQPGFKVLHIPDFDYNTHHYTFKSALAEVKAWSDAHPKHIPFIILVESKTGTVADVLPNLSLTESIPFDAAAADAIDEEIKSVFGVGLEQVISPDEVRGSYSTLEEAILADSWPTLGEARGKIMFVMEGAAVSHYKSGHPSLQGRAMFVYADPGEDEAAFVIMNNSKGDEAAIHSLVEQGYMVRTRADSDTEEARTGDYTTMNAAISSGAQIISTDYYKADERYITSSDWTDYHVSFSDGTMFRINPVSAADKVSLGDLKEY